MTHYPTEAEIEAATNAPFVPGAGVVVVPGEPDAAKKVLSARVPEVVSRWIYDEALKRKISPSMMTSELLVEAIAARQHRRVLTPDDVLAAARAYAEYMQEQPEIAERLAQRANLPRVA